MSKSIATTYSRLDINRDGCQSCLCSAEQGIIFRLSRLRIWSRETEVRPSPSRVSHIILRIQAKSGAYWRALLLSPDFHDGVHPLYRQPSSILIAFTPPPTPSVLPMSTSAGTINSNVEINDS